MAPPDAPTFTERIRQELAHLPTDVSCDREAELAALLHLGASLHLTGGDAEDRWRLRLTTPDGAIARRAYALLHAVHGLRAELHVEAPSGVRTTTRYVLVVSDGARALAHAVGLLDGDGRPVRRPLPPIDVPSCDRVAYVRGAFLAVGSCSAPGRAPHLELAVADEDTAAGLATLVGDLADHRALVSPSKGAWRAVLKSGTAIATFLATVGATDSYLRYEERLLRRQLRNDATRLANADAANLRRTIETASSQVREVAWAVEVVGWDDLDQDLRQTALARLANPSSSLAEIGELLDPPVDKSTVHRRLKRVVRLGQQRLAGRTDPGPGRAEGRD